MNGIQVCSNGVACPFIRGDNYEIAKIHRQNFKASSLKPGQNSTKLKTNYSCKGDTSFYEY